MDCIQAARDFVARNYSVIPVATDGTKEVPVAWAPYQDRLANGRELSDWIEKCGYGIGVVTGDISQHLHVFDFDHQGEATFGKWWNQVATQLPEITNQIAVVATPRPGRHVWFRQSSQVPGQQVLARELPIPTGQFDADGQSILKPPTLIETRGTGNYVVAPGGPLTVHRTQLPYELIHGSFDLQPLPDEVVEQLLDIARSFNRYDAGPKWKSNGQAYVAEPRPGDVFNANADFAELLTRHGWQRHSIKPDGSELWTRPGKSIAEGHSASLGHIRDDDGRPLLYVFTSSAHPLEEQQCYDPFGFLTHMEHGGDFSTAAAVVREQFRAELAKQKREYYAVSLPSSFQKFVPFPVHIFPEMVQQFVRTRSESIGVDSSMIAVPLLSVLGSLIGHSRRIELKDDWTEHPSLWTGVICGVGEAKTPSMNAAKVPAAAVVSQLKAANEVATQQWIAECKATGKKVAKPALKQLVVSYATIEVIRRRMQFNRSLLYAKGELRGWVNSFNQYKGAGEDGEMWLRFWDGYAEELDRVQDDLHVDGAECCICVTGTIQPSVAATVFLADKHTANGLSARMLLCHPTNPFQKDSGHSAPEGKVLTSQMKALGREMYALAGTTNALGEVEPLSLRIDEAAHQLFFDFKNNMKWQTRQMDQDAPLTNAYTKMDTNLARTALILSVTRQVLENTAAEHVVSADDMRNALAVIEWFIRETGRFYGQLDEGPRETFARKVMTWMDRSGRTDVSARDVVIGIRDISSTAEAEAVLHNMYAAGLGEMFVTGKSHRFRLS